LAQEIDNSIASFKEDARKINAPVHHLVELAQKMREGEPGGREALFAQMQAFGLVQPGSAEIKMEKLADPTLIDERSKALQEGLLKQLTEAADARKREIDKLTDHAKLPADESEKIGRWLQKGFFEYQKRKKKEEL